MEWFNATSYLPKNKQKVMISEKGVYYLVQFDQEKNFFKLVGELKETFFNVSEHIYWTEFIEPK
jgi:hypothetical protein